MTGRKYSSKSSNDIMSVKTASNVRLTRFRGDSCAFVIILSFYSHARLRNVSSF